jgi:membrane glycosyltransferase
LVNALLFACLAIGTLWTVFGFKNILIGLWMLQGVPDGLARVSGFAKAADDGDVPSGQFGEHSHSVR